MTNENDNAREILKEEARKELIEDEIKFLKSLLQTRQQKKLSKARTQDTGRKTIPDLYDIRIKERIKELEKKQNNTFPK